MTNCGPRPLHDHASLSRLFAPASVAFVGLSAREGSFGQRAWANMAGFTGRLYAVNPKYQRYEDQPCYPHLAALPEVPDCVLLALPRELCEDALQECVRLGVRSAVLFASGYAETGLPERIAEQERLAALARESGLRILGPNCMGFANNALAAGLTFVMRMPFGETLGHGIGLVSQSGAVAFALVEAVSRGKTFSHVLTAGNAVDVDVADEIAFLAEEPECKVIACVLEGVRDPRRLIEAGHRARRAGKAVVMFKMARSDQGAAAAVSHTGTLAGSDAAYATTFKQAGMVVVDHLEHLLDTASFFAKSARTPKAAPGVAVLSASGGMAIMAVDQATLVGVPLPQPSPPVLAVLEAHVPEFGSARNPCDATAQVATDMEALVACGEAMLSDPAYGALVYPHPSAHDVATERLRRLDEAAMRQLKLCCVVWVTEWLEGPGAATAEAMAHTAVFRSTQACFVALRARTWWQDQSFEQSRAWGPVPPGARATAQDVLRMARSNVLTEGEGMRILSAYGIPVVEDRLVGSADDAVAAADALGYPVVMKIVSPQVPHKTEAGGVKLNMRDAQAVREAFEQILKNVRAKVPGARLDGVVVQPMVPASVELVLGGRRDPVFGPLLVVGLGGIFVEVIKDVAIRMAPVTQQDAREMLAGLRGVALLNGFRGGEPVDIDRLADIIACFSTVIADLGAEIEEIDVNPLICRGATIIAVDALVRRTDMGEIST